MNRSSVGGEVTPSGRVLHIHELLSEGSAAQGTSVRVFGRQVSLLGCLSQGTVLIATSPSRDCIRTTLLMLPGRP